MILATDPETGIDADLFNASEEKQDQATDELTFAITRMSNILLKNKKLIKITNEFNIFSCLLWTKEKVYCIINSYQQQPFYFSFYSY